MELRFGTGSLRASSALVCEHETCGAADIESLTSRNTLSHEMYVQLCNLIILYFALDLSGTRTVRAIF